MKGATVHLFISGICDLRLDGSFCYLLKMKFNVNMWASTPLVRPMQPGEKIIVFRIILGWSRQLQAWLVAQKTAATAVWWECGRGRGSASPLAAGGCPWAFYSYFLA
jgi:hypothetical protein